MSSDLATDVLSIMSRSRFSYENPTVLIFPGRGEIGRIDYGLTHSDDMCRHHRQNMHVMIAGDNPDQPMACIFENKKDLQRARLDAHHVTLLPSMPTRYSFQGVARNTKQQADWAAKVLSNEPKGPVHLVVSAYHMPRAFMTLVASIIRELPDISDWPQIIPYPTGLEFSMDRFTNEEAPRIATYRTQGDVATSEQLALYLKATHRR